MKRIFTLSLLLLLCFSCSKDTFWDTDRYIIFKDGGERAIKITASTLELYELCFDCFFHKYKRK